MDLEEFLRRGQSFSRFDEKCSIDIKLQSPGIFDKNGVEDFLGYSLPRLQLQLALMFLLTQCLHLLLKRFNLPRNFSEILAGIILGKSILGKILGPNHEKLFPDEDVLMQVLTAFGFMFFMFLVGVKMDPGLMFKSGRKGFSIGLCAFAGPLVAGNYLGANKVVETYLPVYRRPAIRSVIRIVSLTSFPVISALLIDLKIMNTELGRLSLSSALISDLMCVLAQSVAGTFRIYISDFGLPLSIIIFTQNACVFLVSIFCTRPLFLKIIQRTREGKPVKNIYITMIGCGVLVGGIACDNVGLPYHFAPFVMGLAVPDGPPLGSTLTDKLDTFISGLLAPLILTYCAIKIDIGVYYDFSFIKIIINIILTLTAVKFVCVLGPALLNKVPIRDSVTLSIILCTQGIVQGASYDNIYKVQSVDHDIFSLLILSLCINALLSHLLVKFLYNSRTYVGYQKRNILHTPYHAELRVLTCVHRQDDAIAAIKLLELSHPSKESPLAIYVLNLVELVGRATPLLINHGLGQKNTSAGSRSKQMIDLFQKFADQYMGVVNVQVFTAISLLKFMHYDICSLSFDKLASLIILPFHRKWSQQGKIVFDSVIQRTINQQVLDMSPCSVGILVDRRKIHHHKTMSANHGLPQDSVYHIAVIFLGGADDREALAYAKRMMMQSLGIRLNVTRIVASSKGLGNENQWDAILDTEILRDIKLQAAHHDNVMYKEEKARDGPDTALIINTIMEDGDFDLIMVGRRQTANSPLLSGLSEWSDLPELGSIGDILASSDINKPVSILVMQQQIIGTK